MSKKVLFFILFLSFSLAAVWFFSSSNSGAAAAGMSMMATQPALRRSLTAEPTISIPHVAGDTGKWLEKQLVCSGSEFLLQFFNQDDRRQIDIFFSRGQSDDRISLTSGGPKAKIYQCCPRYEDGLNIHYKFHGENQWFKYPEKINHLSPPMDMIELSNH